METIKVNMNPNPLDVQTIHASQNDGEARQWGFELHNNGDVIDASEINDQLVFKAYKGGTEQILPENGSVPTTSPIIADIKYPHGELTDQEFLYRQSPTEEDGLAKITDIKGNTLVWNQLVQNGNFENTNGWNPTRGTITANNNICQFTATETGNLPQANRINYPNITPLANHSYLVSAYIKAPRNTVGTIGFTQIDYWQSFNLQANVRTKVSTIYNFSNVSTNINLGIGAQANANDVIEISNVQMFDLTQMGLDITVSDFTSLFPLSYYSYNQGSLLSFNGNGIKTVGFNLFDQDSVLTNVGFVKQSDGSFYIQYPSDANYKVLFENKLKYSGQFFLVYKYKYVNTTSQGCRFEVHYTDGSVDQIYASGSNDFVEVSFISRANKVVDYISGTYGSNIGTWWKDVCINISDPSKNGTYEPYTSSTLSLPISTYFPNGMDGVGTDYDELTNTKASTRMTRVDLGSLDWTKESRQNRFNSRALADAKVFPSDSVANAICDKYIIVSSNDTYLGNDGLSIDSGGRVNIHDTAYTSATASDFKTAMSGVYLVYPLATPTETPITTASLVTENAEIPLSNNDGVLIGKCTEELSAEPGFHDAKIKLADADGECYSNKIQLHVERSPQ